MNSIYENFPWGKIVATHKIGNIRILEYIDKHDGNTQYHPFIGEKDSHCLSNTLDAAIIVALDEKYGHSGRAAQYACKMLDIPM